MSVYFVVDVRATGVLFMLRNGEKRMGWTAAAAINKTMDNIQAAQRLQVQRVFNVRKSEFLKRQAAIIKPRATATSLWSRVRVGSKKGLLLPLFEAGASRLPQKAVRAAGENAVAVPKLGGPARPSIAEIIPEPMWVQRIGLKKRLSSKATKGSGVITFLVPGKAIMRRVVGAAKEAAQVLYLRARRPVRLKPVLSFHAHALREANKFPIELTRQIAATFRYQFGGGR